ncbi:hypothetical protein GCM10017653_23350 [Ancylobacter defluvii]|uniref:Uncharacterized protein n=1 Tax=Ancylobacter defluvii TaxID=1282440 RepID=A0A9W6NB64_9HYPH|nr:hypothetical protein GCM10017653_23350 [Ancylobacter defluvii]
MARPPAEIEPVRTMASSRAILPGPMRPSGSRSIRMESEAMVSAVQRVERFAAMRVPPSTAPSGAAPDQHARQRGGVKCRIR